MTHSWNASVAARFSELAAGAGRNRTVLLLDAETEPQDLPDGRDIQLFQFDSKARLATGKYAVIGPTLVPGHCHFPLLWYYSRYPQFSYYWLVEYDVAFSGDWNTLFEGIAGYTHDFVTCHIRTPQQEPDWYWWNSLNHPSERIDRANCLRSYNPISRLSASALQYLHRMHLSGWRGHNEVLLPTLLSHAGFSLLDMGGDGPFVPKGLKNRYYTSYSRPDGKLYMLGTMRFRPSYRRPGRTPGYLYHPVKDIAARGMRETLAASINNLWEYCCCCLSIALQRIRVAVRG